MNTYKTEKKLFPKDTVVAQRGSRDDNVFFLLKGSVGSFVENELFFTLNEPSSFGTAEPILGQPRKIEYKTLTNCEILVCREKSVIFSSTQYLDFTLKSMLQTLKKIRNSEYEVYSRAYVENILSDRRNLLKHLSEAESKVLNTIYTIMEYDLFSRDPEIAKSLLEYVAERIFRYSEIFETGVKAKIQTSNTSRDIPIDHRDIKPQPQITIPKPSIKFSVMGIEKGERIKQLQEGGVIAFLVSGSISLFYKDVKLFSQKWGSIGEAEYFLGQKGIIDYIANEPSTIKITSENPTKFIHGYPKGTMLAVKTLVNRIISLLNLDIPILSMDIAESMVEKAVFSNLARTFSSSGEVLENIISIIKTFDKEDRLIELVEKNPTVVKTFLETLCESFLKISYDMFEDFQKRKLEQEEAQKTIIKSQFISRREEVPPERVIISENEGEGLRFVRRLTPANVQKILIKADAETIFLATFGNLKEDIRLKIIQNIPKIKLADLENVKKSYEGKENQISDVMVRTAQSRLLDIALEIFEKKEKQSAGKSSKSKFI